MLTILRFGEIFSPYSCHDDIPEQVNADGNYFRWMSNIAETIVNYALSRFRIDHQQKPLPPSPLPPSPLRIIGLS